MAKKTVSYKDAGVDIDKAASFVEQIKPLIKATSRKEVLGNIGNYGGLFHLDTEKYKSPVLVSATDGVGTKLKIAQLMDKHDTVGIDLVAMNTNDLIVQGAEPLFFLDYIATGKLDVEKSVKIIEGIAQGCTESGCALIGGETAEMPGFYDENEYDLAGFCVGIVEREKVIDGSEIRVGDQIIGMASNGIHSNGFSLARKVLFDLEKLTVNDMVEGLDHSIGEELLRPTRIYVKSILNLIKNFTIKGIIHITGGGFIDNIPRIIPEPCQAVIKIHSWEIPPIFTIIQERGNIDDMEMVRVFNMGIGMMIVVSEKDSEEIMERLEMLGEKAYLIGSVGKRDNHQPSVIFV
ncbi:MAG TPA: phosphoribosylformylglycinamidine cyclo-ligase [Deltaproteobacteria bacterium]|nr:phosphoribosylformylglycinamidine cyclo-ligase [Deltaproteobacteria bacterium]